MTVWKAFANSHNGVFSRVPKKSVAMVAEKYTAALASTNHFSSDLPVGKSLADLPNDRIKLERAAAGLNRDFLINGHDAFASIVSTVLNRGKTMKTYLVDYVVQQKQGYFQT